VDVKGIDVLLRAAVIAAEHMDEDQEIEIKIFGGNKQHASESYLAKIEEILEDAPENLKITEMGSYSRDNVFDLMTSVDWVVTPSVWPETFGLVVSEAWDARRPVIASRAGGLGDRVKDGENGLSFLPGSAAQLARILQDCTGNSESWRAMAGTMKDEITLDAAWESHKQIIADLPR
jgi:glycosyltransferase involved in cell wall biosynthesis